MNKRQALKRWRETCERWVGRLGLLDYERTYKIEPGEPQESQNSGSSGNEAAWIYANARYKWLSVTASHGFVNDATNDELDEAACHEIVHALIEPIDSVAREIIDSLPVGRREGYSAYRTAMLESTTTHITHALRLFKRKKRTKRS